MNQAPEPPDFECPFCKSKIAQKNAAKHLLNQHQDTQTLHKYVSCSVCSGLFLKHKLTPHMRAAHGKKPEANAQSNKPSKKARKQR